MHVDDFIDDPKSDRYAAEWLRLFRRPEITKLQAPNEAKLFTTYKGKRWRVMGCSRLGDVWLNITTHEPEFGYVLRVDVDACSNWSATPGEHIKPEGK